MNKKGFIDHIWDTLLLILFCVIGLVLLNMTLTGQVEQRGQANIDRLHESFVENTLVQFLGQPSPAGNVATLAVQAGTDTRSEHVLQDHIRTFLAGRQDHIIDGITVIYPNGKKITLFINRVRRGGPSFSNGNEYHTSRITSIELPQQVVVEARKTEGIRGFELDDYS